MGVMSRGSSVCIRGSPSWTTIRPIACWCACADGKVHQCVCMCCRLPQGIGDCANSCRGTPGGVGMCVYSAACMQSIAQVLHTKCITQGVTRGREAHLTRRVLLCIFRHVCKPQRLLQNLAWLCVFICAAVRTDGCMDGWAHLHPTHILLLNVG